MERVAETVQRLKQDASQKRIVIAIDGRCAGGKTTLGSYLEQEFDANLFHMDDFFLQAGQRTKERLAQPGGNVDYERFKTEVLEPVLFGKEVCYRRFDCGSMQILEGVRMPVKRINIIEGAYSQHPYFGSVYDLKIFLDIDKVSQIENIRRRDGAENLKIFVERWIPMEEAYCKAFDIKEQSDLVWRYKG